MAARTGDHYLFGGNQQPHRQCADRAVWQWQRQGAGRCAYSSGGLSGVAFGEVCAWYRVSPRVPTGGGNARITQADHNVAVELDGEPALDVMLRDLAITLTNPRRRWMPCAQPWLVWYRPPVCGTHGTGPHRQFGRVVVRHIIGLDPVRRGLPWPERLSTGRSGFLPARSRAAAADLTRICAEIREELEDAELLGAVYVSCTGRGGRYFGADSAELQRVRQALGDVPLVGFFAAGEIAYQHLYGYTGVLTVFASTP